MLAWITFTLCAEFQDNEQRDTTTRAPKQTNEEIQNCSWIDW